MISADGAFEIRTAMRRSVLFVDDEPFILEGFKRIYRHLRSEYDMLFSSSGKEALQIMASQPLDVVVSDIRMPEMDGVELLRVVAECYPRTVRIALSGHADDASVVRALEFTHQYLTKPCPPETLQFAINRSCLLRDLVQNDLIKELVAKHQKLPSLPQLYMQLEEEIQSPNVSMERVGEIIVQDAAMTVRVLQMVNSAFYGLREPITSPQEAAVYLGSETIKMMVLHLSLSVEWQIDPQLPDVTVEGMWRHGILVASLARKIAQMETPTEDIHKNAFVAGILHDIGKLVLSRSPSPLVPVKQYVREKEVPSLKAEYEVLGTSHAEVGAYLLGLWGIPDVVVEAVGFHHNPSKSVDNAFSALTALHVASALLGDGGTKNIDDNYIARLFLRGKIPQWEESCGRMKDEILEKEARWTKKYLL
jgi:putative nucleotidyltransferase with HDIG domain